MPRPRHLADLLVLALCAWIFREALRDGAPMGMDHPVHLLRSELFWQRLWSTHRIAGWTSAWSFGYPAEDLYPPGTVIWVALARVLTFGLFDAERTYGLAVFAAYTLQVHAVFALARRFVGTPAALLGAALWVVDAGTSKVGGYYYVVHAGVWGQALGLGFFLRGWLALERGRGGPTVGAWWAAALLTHLITLPMVAVLLVVRGLARPAASASGLAWTLALSAWWFLPFLARRDEVNQLGEPGFSLASLATGALTGTPVVTGWAWAGPAALLGLGYALATRRRGVLPAAGFAATMVWLSSWDAYALVLHHLGHSFGALQYARFLQPAKALVFPLAGAGVVALAALTLKARPRPLRGVALVLLALATVDLSRQIAAIHALSGTLPTNAGAAWRTVREAGAWLDAHADPAFARVAIDLAPGEYAWHALPALTGMGVYATAYTPAKLFEPFPALPHPELYQRASVRYIVKPAAAAVAPLATFGHVAVEAAPDWTPRRWSVTGEADVEELAFDDREMRFLVRSVAEDARLILHVARYSRWEATLAPIGGPPSPLPIEAIPIEAIPPAPGFDPVLMALPLRPGEVSVRWGDPPVDRASALASLAAGGLWVWGLARRHRRGTATGVKV